MQCKSRHSGDDKERKEETNPLSTEVGWLFAYPIGAYNINLDMDNMEVEQSLFKVYVRALGFCPARFNHTGVYVCQSVCCMGILMAIILWTLAVGCLEDQYVLDAPSRSARFHPDPGNCFRQVLLMNDALRSVNETNDGQDLITFFPDDTVLQLRFLVSSEHPHKFVEPANATDENDEFERVTQTGFSPHTESRWEFATSSAVIDMPPEMRKERRIRVKQVVWPVLWECSGSTSCFRGALWDAKQTASVLLKYFVCTAVCLMLFAC